MAAVSFALCTALSALVATGRILPLDTSVLLSLGAERRSWLSPLMYVASTIGGGGVAIPAALLFAYLLWLRRRKADAQAYTIIALSGWALYAIAKLAIGRARPHVISHLYQGAGWYSYPSGHSTLAPIVFGLAAVLWSAPWPSAARRWALVAAAGLLSLVIAFSRVYIGVHYPSDAVGGLLLGVTWSSFWFWWWGTAAEKTAA
ncbi:MAG: phosphatase PAP2 family protein [Gemmatimonadales bacterium]